ncbi:hypothetical protein EVAR_81815_1 [Eumeta japonica]|uniref:Uncharacterized protein n=1 Tax=Eumeta variegata TaxID=151549 RepID=A0A4C1TGX7_EUMVA|nr:hypothetical protein EVAR_81815_1 [Eumeta japonica]
MGLADQLGSSVSSVYELVDHLLEPVIIVTSNGAANAQDWTLARVPERFSNVELDAVNAQDSTLARVERFSNFDQLVALNAQDWTLAHGLESPHILFSEPLRTLQTGFSRVFEQFSYFVQRAVANARYSTL